MKTSYLIQESNFRNSEASFLKPIRVQVAYASGAWI